MFAAILAIALAALLASCAHPTESADFAGTPGKAGGASNGFTPEFRQFLEIRQSQLEITRTEEVAGYTYTLEAGVLRVCDETGGALWQPEDSWYVEDFRLGDVDGDGNADLLFTLWKSYSFGAYHPERMENDDPAVRCHLFLYTLRAGQMKQLWGSSSLPRPIYEFELSLDGEKSPVTSGAVLRTTEGRYTDDFSRTDAREYVYVWRKWGFAQE